MKLQNQDIWLAYPKLVQLSKIKFPVKVGLGIAKLLITLQQPYVAIERERIKLVNHYGVVDTEKKTVTVDQSSPEYGDYSVEFGQLLSTYWDDEFQFERVKLPEQITVTCGSCGKKTNINFIVDPQVLLPLEEKFVGLQDGS